MATPQSPTPSLIHAADAPRWLATCPHETRDLLITELSSLGTTILEPLHRGVVFQADLQSAYRAHFSLRTASRIQRLLADLPASSISELSRHLGTIDWPVHLRNHRPFTVQPVLTDAASQSLGQSPLIALIADSVHHRFADAHLTPPPFKPDDDNALAIVAHLRNNLCTLGLDTAGRALHKRGWRINGHPAVIKETLAASILLLAGYDGSQPILDPMCGSGTLIIEAAYIALNKAPLIHRGKDDFAIEHLAGFDRALWRKVADKLRADKLPQPRAPLFASDIRDDFVDLARRGALRARVEKFISFQSSPFENLQPPADSGLLVMNLPYGQRIGRDHLLRLYTTVGQVIRSHYSHWRLALLLPDAGPTSALQLPHTRRIPLTNGSLPVHLLLRD